MRVFWLIFLVLTTTHGFSQSSTTDYRDYALNSANWVIAKQDSLIRANKNKHKSPTINQYSPDHRFLDGAVIFAELAKESNSDPLALKSVLLLDKFLSMGEKLPSSLRENYTGQLPLIPNYFQGSKFFRAVATLQEQGKVADDKLQEWSNTVSSSITYLMDNSEWGTMNRAALRMEMLAWAIRAFPNHEDMQSWSTHYQMLKIDNTGRWSPEDASMYQAIWFYALLGDAMATKSASSFLLSNQGQFYPDYFLQLIAPNGNVADFGDSRYDHEWARFVPIFEAAAAQQNSRELKWAAEQIASTHANFKRHRSTSQALKLLDAYLLGSKELTPTLPKPSNHLVLDDVIAKKILFRNGWTDTSNFLLLNYKDQPVESFRTQNYLRTTLPVPDEKGVHGHSDENSIAALYHHGSLLLSDAGYRTTMPSGPNGEYRSDYFHNRACFRRGIVDLESLGKSPNIWDIFPNLGRHQQSTSQLIDYYSCDEFQYSRTRIVSEDGALQNDRVILVFEADELYLVQDFFKILKGGEYTLGTVWHGQNIKHFDHGGYSISNDTIHGKPVKSDFNLDINFLSKTGTIFQGTIERHHTGMNFLTHVKTGAYSKNETICFSSGLIPYSRTTDNSDMSNWQNLYSREKTPNALNCQFSDSNRTISITTKIDLDKGVDLTKHRPARSYEGAKIKSLEGIETDADLVVSKLGKTDHQTYLNVSTVKLDGKVWWESKTQMVRQMLNNDEVTEEHPPVRVKNFSTIND